MQPGMISSVKTMKAILYILGGMLFILSAVAYLYVRLRLHPKDDPDLENIYYEFEHLDPAYASYSKWSRITFLAVIIAMLLLFLAVAI